MYQPVACCGLALALLSALTACSQVGLQEAGKGVSVAGAVVEMYPSGAIAFGGVSPHGESSEQAVIFRSTGDTAAIVQKIFFSDAGEGAFTLADNPTPFRLDVDEARTLKVRFDPDTQKQYQGAMTVEVRGDEVSWLERAFTGAGCRDQNRDGVCEQGFPEPPVFDSGDTGLD